MPLTRCALRHWWQLGKLIEFHLEPLLGRSNTLYGLDSCVAQICPEQFTVFYDHFMPGIKSLLTEATAPELSELRGKAIECAGLIGEAVGAQTFARDALEIMRIFVHAMVNILTLVTTS
jgi:hypothetical protein